MKTVHLVRHWSLQWHNMHGGEGCLIINGVDAGAKIAQDARSFLAWGRRVILRVKKSLESCRMAVTAAMS